MSTQLFYEAISRFEAACHVDILPENHRARGLHGHSYIVRARTAAEQESGEPGEAKLDALRARLDVRSALLNYTLLNDSIAIPTDENIARWFREGLDLPDATIGIQSTTDAGADLDSANDVHIWRRFRFEAAHVLPNVPAGHKCGRMHGHGFEVVIHVQQPLPGSEAMGLDFDLIGERWRVLHEQLHNSCLNDIAGLENPTSEHIAAWIWQRLKPDLPELSWISVYETKSSGCHHDGEHFRIWKEQSFESAVRLADANGSMKLSGHSYLVRLHLSCDLDQMLGWTVDFGEVKEKFRQCYQLMDHHCLNDIATLHDANLGAVLEWMRQQLAGSLPELDRIDLYQQPGCGALLCWGEDVPALPTKSL